MRSAKGASWNEHGGADVAAPRTRSDEEKSGRVRFGSGPLPDGQGHRRSRDGGRRGRQAGARGRPRHGRGHTGHATVHGFQALAGPGCRRLGSGLMCRRLVTRRRGCVGQGARRSGAGHQHREGTEQHHHGVERAHHAHLGAAAAGFKRGRHPDPAPEPPAGRHPDQGPAASASRSASDRTSSRPADRPLRHGSRAPGAGRPRRRWCRCR